MWFSTYPSVVWTVIEYTILSEMASTNLFHFHIERDIIRLKLEKYIISKGIYTMREYETIKELMDTICDMYHDREAFIFKQEGAYKRKNYGDFKKDYEHFAKRLVEEQATGIHTALLVKTSYNGLTALFGTIFATNTAVVPDYNYTDENIEALLKQTDTSVILYDDEFAEKANALLNRENTVTRIISIQALMEYTLSSQVTIPVQKPDKEAIILFTSGTTGHSKAVMLTNQNICANSYALAANYGADDVAQTTGNTSIATAPIHHAMFLVYVTTQMQEAISIYFNTDISTILEDMKVIRPTAMTVIPAIIEMIYNEVMRKSKASPNIPVSKILRSVTGGRLYGMACGSTRLEPKYMKAFWDWGIAIIEAYGMTEASPTISHNNYKNFKQGSVGKPLPGIEVKIVDGEIWTKSKCIMKGYYKDPESTRQVMEDGWLKTGDLGYFDEEGYLFITGRKKNLIKLSNGENVSPEELESLLILEDKVDECVAFEYNNTISAEIYYQNWESYNPSILWEQVHTNVNHVNQQLPSYKKIQSFRIRKTPFPKNRMQKLTRMGIGQGDYISAPEVAFREAKNDVERKLISIWSRELDLNNIKVSDNFFELGGNSLLARHVVNRIEEELHVKLTLNDMFDRATVAELAELIELMAPSEYIHLDTAKEQESYVMSALQKRMFQIYEADKTSTAYNIPIYCRLSQMPDRKQLENALYQIASRHDIMRTSFHYMDNQYRQVVHKEPVVDFQYMESSCSYKEASKNFIKPFVLEEAPLFRVVLLHAEDGDYLLLDIHHIISDGTSIFLLFEELSALYQGNTLEPVSYQYKDYSEWLQGQGKNILESQKNYWLDCYKETAPILDYPTDFPRSAVQSSKGERLTFVLDSQTTRQITTYGLKNKSTLYTTLLSCLMVTLSKYTRQEDIVIGTPVAGRSRRETEGMLGMFVNTLALRGYPEKSKTFSDFQKEVKENYLLALTNQDYPFDNLLEDLSIQWTQGRNPLFDIMFTLQNEETPDNRLGDIPFTFIQPENPDVQFDLALDVRENDGELVFIWEYRSHLFQKESITLLQKHFCRLLEEILADDNQRIQDISLLTEEEKEFLFSHHESQNKVLPMHTLVELFEEQVKTAPDAIAVRYVNETLTYEELNQKANQIAHILRNAGIQPNDFVAILAQKSLQMSIAVYGVLKSGAAYVPIAPDYPKERIQYMLEDCQPKAVLYYYEDMDLAEYQDSVKVLSELEKQQESPMVINLAKGDYERESAENLPLIGKGTDLAYVIYTSGTTGKPKGVLINHAGVVNHTYSLNMAYKMKPEDIILQFANFCFDQAVSDMFTPLPTHSSIALIPESARKDPDKLISYINDLSVTVLPLTPSYISLIKPAQVPNLRFLDSGGEAGNLSVLKNWIEAGKEVINAYGPTETTITATYSYITKETQHLTIGRPMDNLSIFIMEGEHLCGIGVPGELCIAGIGVARGYLNREELTKEKFVKNPYGDGSMYRTGDLARWLPDGTIDFLGRIDEQVKIRGYRIEPGEIENAIGAIKGVKDAAVIARKDSQGDQQLYGYYVTDTGLTPEEIKDYIALELPPYMIPAGIMKLPVLPKTSNGKLNKQMLPEITVGKSTSFIAPRNKLEQNLCHMFEEILGIAHAGIKDDFFELGGHSIKAIRLLNQIEEHTGIRILLTDVFQNTTVEKLASFLNSEKESQYESIPVAEKRPYYPMSSTQKRMFVIHQMEPESLMYHMPFGIRIDKSISKDRIHTALSELIKRHEILRTRFLLVDGQPVQEILEHVEPDFTYREEEHVNQNELMKQFIQPFSLDSAPLFRVSLIKSSQAQYMLFDIHHIISDGTSFSIMMDEFNQLCVGKALPKLTHQYKDYSQWFASRDLSKSKAYWVNVFAGEIPVLHMPTDMPRPPKQSHKGASYYFGIGKKLSQNIRKTARKMQFTEYGIFLSAAMILLGKYSNQEDIIIGSPVSGRIHKDTESILGMFVNTLSMRGKPEPEKSINTFLMEMKEQCVLALEHQEYPFEDLVEDLHLDRDVSRNPLFDVMLIMQNTQMSEVEETTDINNMFRSSERSAKFDLTFDIAEYDGEYEIDLEYCSDLYLEGTIHGMADHFLCVLEQITQNENRTIGDMDLLTHKDKELLSQINDTRVTYPAGQTVVHRFQEQVSHTPDAIAVICGEESVTYRQLNDRVNQITCSLLQSGMQKGEIIAVLADRSISMIAAIYGIMKAGGAYLPIDPDYPKERIQYMLLHSKTRRAMVQNGYEDKTGKDTQVIFLSSCFDEKTACNEPAIFSEPGDLAYVLYTSGSTGKPKGVMIEQQQLSNFILGMEQATTITSYQNVLSLTTVCFDIFGLELHVPLANGMTVILSRKNEDIDATAVSRLIVSHQVEVMQSTPSRYKLLLQNEVFQKALSKVKVVLVGGEAFPEDLLEILRTYENLQIFNMYGPTETTIWSSVKDLTHKESKLTVGRPIANTTFYVVDKDMHILPPGLKGELCIGGDGVGRGYIHAEELTMERFVTLPDGERVYRTGDLACMLRNQDTVCLGRMDSQVKIRGYRVELEEIEHTLLMVPQIQSAAVVIRNTGTNAEICAYYTVSEPLSISEIREKLVSALPAYMIPAYYVELEKMPLTLNGKIDRKKLPAPQKEDRVQKEYVAPSSREEKMLCNIFSKMLSVEKISVHDNFFELGGNSITAVMMEPEIKEHFPQYEISFIFTYSTPETLAEYLNGLMMEHEKEKLVTTQLGQITTEFKNFSAEEGSYVLPVKYPVITTNTSHAHLLSILNTADYTLEWLICNYIQVYSYKDIATYRQTDFYFPLPNIIRPLETCPWLVTQRVSCNMLRYMNIDILDFIVNALQHNTYLDLMVDYYYIKQSMFYKREHFIHDMMIYGYNERKRTLFAADFLFESSGAYTNAEIYMDDLKAAYENCPLEEPKNYFEGQFFLYSLKEGNAHIFYEFDKDNILRSLKNYCNCIIPEFWEMYHERTIVEMSFGLDVYDAYQIYIRKLLKDGNTDIDFRYFYVMLDHKRIMQVRLRYLSDYDKEHQGAYKSLLKEYEALEAQMEEVILLLLKGNMEGNAQYFESVISLLSAVKEKERKSLHNFFEEIPSE